MRCYQQKDTTQLLNGPMDRQLQFFPFQLPGAVRSED